jgi:maltose alpha-D-glucosyltransferase/alpha-amylase
MPIIPRLLHQLRGSIRGIPDLIFRSGREHFETTILPDYLQRCRWFGGKTKQIRAVRLEDYCCLGEDSVALGIVAVEYVTGEPELYTLPLSIQAQSSAEVRPEDSNFRIASCAGGEATFLYEATGIASFQKGLYRLFSSTSRQTERGQIRASIDREDKSWTQLPPDHHILGAEQSNSSVLYGDRVLVKLLRRLQPGTNPEVELGRVLSQRHFRHSARLLGDLEYRAESGFACTLAVAQEFAPNQGDTWDFALRQLEEFYSQVPPEGPGEGPNSPLPPRSALLKPPAGRERARIGIPPAQWSLLGRRTAQLHKTLASESESPAFAPEPVDSAFVSTLSDSMDEGLGAARSELERRGGLLPETVGRRVQRLLENWPRLEAPIDQLRSAQLSVSRIRIHGDYHLGQVLVQKSDFMIIDFEGEPLRPIEERRAKKIALADVAGMLRSFHYAACAVLFGLAAPCPPGELMPWARYWSYWVSSEYLRAYLKESGAEPFLPSRSEDVDLLLRCCLIEKALYELRYELNNRPTWVEIPLEGLIALAEEGIGTHHPNAMT